MTDWGAASVTDHRYKANSSNALMSPFSYRSNCNRHARSLPRKKEHKDRLLELSFQSTESRLPCLALYHEVILDGVNTLDGF